MLMAVRLVPVLVALIAAAPLAAPVEAQRVEPSVYFGMRASVGGQVIVPVPAPASSGFLSIPRTFRETSGTIVGASARVRLLGALGLNTGVAVAMANRLSESPDATLCRKCSSTLVSGLLGLAVRHPLTTRLLVEAGVGGELIHLGGDAYAEPLDVLASADVVPTRRVVGGTNASLGSVLSLQRGGAIMLNAQWRRYHITSRWTDPTFEQTAGSIVSSPYTDLLLTIGWSPQASTTSR